MLAVLIVSRTYGRLRRSLGGEEDAPGDGWKEGVRKRASRRAVPVRQSSVTFPTSRVLGGNSALVAVMWRITGR